MKWDRRRQPRRIPQTFTFLQLERDEGGRVVNLSEEGLRFETFSPIRTANPVPLWFSFNLRDRIEATGEVVWTDAKKEIGGLAFINLSPVARQLIRAHIADLPVEEMPRAGADNGEVVLPAAPSSNAASISVMPRLGELRFPESPAAETPAPAASEAALSAISDSLEQAPLVPLERFVAARRSQFLRGLLFGIVITALILIPIFIYALRSQPGAGGRAAPAVTSPANSRAPSDPSAAQSPSAPSSTVDNPATSKSPSAKPLTDSSGNAAASPARRNVSDSSPAVANPGPSLLAPPASNEPARRKPNAANPDQLWEAVQSGNAKAAVILADLYLRGDGVPVNCAQARILFQFAAQKNNPEGIKKSRELEKSGCPTP